MSEFCKSCAQELGMRPDTPPLFCEGCKKHIDKRLSNLEARVKRIKEILTK